VKPICVEKVTMGPFKKGYSAAYPVTSTTADWSAEAPIMSFHFAPILKKEGRSIKVN
jgi:hypothetical protein